MLSISANNSLIPCSDSEDRTFAANTVQSLKIPLYTVPKPPRPSLLLWSKLFVALLISLYENNRRFSMLKSPLKSSSDLQRHLHISAILSARAASTMDVSISRHSSQKEAPK
uniref:Uncharacterized protein n=1 Tax=Arundo donax TaxID=35708 RepID=A0A0A8Y8S9_ARUDO